MTATPRPAVPAQRTLRFSTDASDAGKRLDRFLSEQVVADGELSRTRLKVLILDGFVRLDGTTTADPSRRLRPEANIEVDVPAVRPAAPAGECMALDIVFEDEHLLVLDKPAGLVVHPAAGHAEGTLVNALIAHCGASLSGIGGVARPGIVHRLDKDTSGLMVVAKTDVAHHRLAALFADHGRTGSLVRRYLALVWGVPLRARGTIDAWLDRSAANREKIAVVGLGRGRRAVTHWEVEERLGPVASLLSCRLETGRTHQIRVHLSHVGHPLLGDRTYGSAFGTKASLLGQGARDALAALGRQALHAAVLGFEHPLTGKILSFESPVPEDFAALLHALRNNS